MMFRVLAVCLVGIAGVASAQTVSVRSGEHGGFTRLTLDLADREDWRMEESPDGVRIVFPGSDMDFDTTRVFDRINRDRLRAIQPTRGQLQLDFACECDLTAFWHADSLLVFDIAEMDPALEGAGEQATAPLSDGYMSPSLDPLSAATARLSRSLEVTLPKDPRADETIPGTIANAASRSELSRIRQKLLRELGRAAGQGLLTPARTSLSFSDPTTTAAASDKDVDTAQRETPPTPEIHATQSSPFNLRVESGVDPDFASRHAGTTRLDKDETCIPEAWVDLPSWGGTDAFHVRIGDLNRRLLREFDQPDAGIALQLARSYLYFGLGAEAREVLDLRPELSPEDQILREIASIMDRATAPAEARIANLVGCGEPAVLWALLARQDMPSETVFDHKALLRSFSSLPAHLREAFGPELASRLIEAGHAQTAQSIIRMTERTAQTARSDLALARANLASVQGKDDTARMELNEAVAKNSEIAPAALAKLIDGLIADALPVPLEKAELAAAYAFENRGTDLGRRMSETYLSALGASNAFAKAVSEFQRLRNDIDDAGISRIAATLMRRMTRDSDDVTFLRHALSDQLVTPDMIPPALGVDVAKRLLASGFAEHAHSFVAPDLPGRSDKPSKLIRAEIALVQERPRQAEVELLDMDDPDATVLRAQARTLAGDHAAAQALYKASDESDLAMQAAWFAQDMDALTRADDPIVRQLAENLQNASQEPATTPDAPFERHRHVLETAQTLRTATTTLLDAKAVPNDP